MTHEERRVRVATNPTTAPLWAQERTATALDLLREVQVWRAAAQVEDGDRRPTGPQQLAKAAHQWQARLDRRLAHTVASAQSPSSGLVTVAPRGSSSPGREDRDEHRRRSWR